MIRVSRSLEAAFSQYQSQVSQIAVREWMDTVRPYLQANGYQFTQGNGSFWITVGGLIYRDSDAEPLLKKEIYELLSEEVPGQPTISFANYMPSNWSPKQEEK